MLLVQDRNAEAATADERPLSGIGNRREAGLRRVEIEHQKRIHRRPSASGGTRTAIASAPAAGTPTEDGATSNLRIVNSLSLNMRLTGAPVIGCSREVDSWTVHRQ
jgi:hypothetical protein